MMTKSIATCMIILASLCHNAFANDETVEHDPVLIGYWQNFKNSASTLRLTEIPEGYTVVTIAFASVNPNGNVKFTLQGPAYKAVANGAILFKSDIKALQKRGVKVLLSLGGLNSFLHVDNTKKAGTLTTSLEQILTDYGFDGVDYDFEGKLNKISSAYLLDITKTLHSDFEKKGTPLLFTLAPEAIDVHWQTSQGKYDPLIDSGLIDYVAVQLYNSSCKRSAKANSPCFAPGTQDFLVSQADSTIQAWTKRGVKSAETHYVLGLPATKRAANNGYIDPAIIRKALTCLKSGNDCATYTPLKTYPQLGGVMTWSINWDAADDYQFHDSFVD